uniref:30S ribosomal protein S2 n=1 Tax=Nephromyces sp. ex Molgula occidentalis TaxID=2544991 RepID=A0A5C1H9L1_9APIC|nr:30S ribosomal protein S2 [Nephromyces sp. ex Molgula occidentalis]
MILITLNELMISGVQIGHKKSRLKYNFNKFIYKTIGKNWIIDLIQTAKYLTKTYSFLYKYGFYNKEILFIGSSSIVKNLIKKTSKLTGQFYINEPFVPGLFTNWTTIRENLLLLKWFYYVNQILNKKIITNKFNLKFKTKFLKIYNKLNYKYKNIKGIKTLPDLIFILDLNKEQLALKEALKLNKIIISIIDSNINPNLIHFPIPGNDNNYFSIKLILQICITGFLHGLLKNKQIL